MKSFRPTALFIVLFCDRYLIVFLFFLLGNWSVQTLSTGIGLVSCFFLKLSINLGFQTFAQIYTKYFLTLFLVFCLPFTISNSVCVFSHSFLD